MIDHRVTSPNHASANGLCERHVQTAKRALQKMMHESRDTTAWEEHLQHFALAYRCSPQEATKFSPYELVFGQQPTLPSANHPAMRQGLDWEGEDVEKMAKEMVVRAKMMKKNAAMAGENSLIAQHRDTLRYARVRDGSYLPVVRRFSVGDYVYVRNWAKTKLSAKAVPVVLRVKEVKESGVLMLEGRCGNAIPVHSSHCSPCHLAGIDGRLDGQLAEGDGSERCEKCGSPHWDDQMLMCEICFKGYHTFCLEPPLESVPEGDWICKECEARGETLEKIAKDRTAQDELPAVARRLFLTAAQKRHLAAAEGLHGRLCERRMQRPGEVEPRWMYGRVVFMGRNEAPRYLRIDLEDGEGERMTWAKVAKLLETEQLRLLPEGAQPPPGVIIFDPEQADQTLSA